MPHLGSHIIRRAVFALALTAVASVSGIWALGAGTTAAGGSPDVMSLDLNIAGNTSTTTLTSPAPVPHNETLGPRDSCARVEPNGIQDFDEDGVDVLGVDLTLEGVDPPDTAYSTPVVVTDGGDGMNASQTTFTVNATETSPGVAMIFPDDGIRVGSERMAVTAVNPGTNVLTVIRGIGGTSAAAHAEGAAVNQTTGVMGFSAVVLYDDSAFTIDTHNPNLFLRSVVGSVAFDPGISSDPGQLVVSAADLGVPYSAEQGQGVLDRIPVTVNGGAPQGLYDLTLTAAGWINSENTLAAADALNHGKIAVGEPCPTSFGDVDCSGGVNSVDSLKVLRFNASLSVTQTDPCVDLGQALPNTEIQGDVDCSNTVNAVDSLKLLRFSAALSVTQNDPCPDIGT